MLKRLKALLMWGDPSPRAGGTGCSVWPVR